MQTMGLEQFKPFVKKRKEEVKQNNEVLLYTRVSSKDQETNKSLKHQMDEGNRIAKEQNFIITSTFGGTYESASGDISRKEFMKLMTAVRSAKKKPFAILINTISRFSRTGGSAIALANELQNLGVHLIEVSSGLSTVTDEGRLEIYRRLINAKQENLDRLKITIPGMRKFLEEGNWLGNVPTGYDQFGPRVKDIKFHSATQKIVINEEGKKLKQAWQWKLQGEPDYIIIKKLAKLGLNIKKQTLSNIWRNPFYCGVCNNSLLDGNLVHGNWEKMISEKDFLYVQEILKGNHFGYKQDRANPDRPLMGFICCNECGRKMSGYEVVKKKVHYYKCQKCKGVSINANITERAKGIGANPLFQNLLNSYTLDSTLIEPFKAQLKLTYDTFTFSSNKEDGMIESELIKLEKELKALKTRFALNPDIDKETYLELKQDFETKITDLKGKVPKEENTISNQDNYFQLMEDVVQNINKYWVSNELETQKRIQELVFPDGLVLDVKSRTYLTKKVNLIFQAAKEVSRVSEGVNEKRQPIYQLPSTLVAGAGFEPTTFGL